MVLIQRKKFSSINNKFDEKLNKLKYENYKYKNEYQSMLEKCLSTHYKLKWVNNQKKFKFYAFSLFSAFCVFNLIKYYYVIYYYIMWEIDIRKPKVSDYIIERFR